MDREVLDKYRRAGKIGANALAYGKSMIKVGESLLKVATAVETYIVDHGAEVAFPANIAINHQAAHFTPKHDETELTFQRGDLVKLDIGAHVDGYICDTAVTVEVGTRNWKSLIDATEDALRVAIESIGPTFPVGRIGQRVEQTIGTYGYLPISNLTGHSLEQYTLHAGLSIPNVADESTQTLTPGTVVAIEPFATTGAGRVDGKVPSNIYIFKQDRRINNKRAQHLLDQIKAERRGLPFSERFCAQVVDKPGRIIQYLVRIGAIASYPILCDIGEGMVSQREHTILITETGSEILSMPD